LLLFFGIALFAFGCDSGGGSDDEDDNGTSPLPAATFSVSGTVSAAPNSAVDSDVNDPNADYAPNNTAEEAQGLSTPATLGGYVNEPLTGQDGRLFEDGDVSDVFAAELLEGDRIVLNIGAPVSEADLDLHLYDAADGTPVDASVSETARIEALDVTETGSYLIQVAVYRGASNYTLTIGQHEDLSIAGSRAKLRLSADFVPGEAIVHIPPLQTAQSRKGSPESLGFTRIAGEPGRSGLFAIEQGISGMAVHRGSPKIPANLLVSPYAMNDMTRAKLETLYAIKEIRTRPDGEAAEPNYIRTGLRTPDDTYYNLQWHYPLINLPEAWELTTGERDVICAVIDTGVLLDHPDLSSNVSGEGYDFIRDPETALDGDGIDPNPNDPGDQSIGGSSFHGTHVAGSIAAVTGNGAGTAGISWNSRILPVRVLGKNSSGTSYDIIQGVRYAAGLSNDSGTTPSRPADIINLSLGGKSSSDAERQAYREARNAGAILIAAAGNTGENAPTYPAAYEEVISVSAVDINANLAPYSNFGKTIDVAAPGGDSTDLNGDGYIDGVWSTSADDSSGRIEYVYRASQGTSMAAPHVAGVAVLMKSLRPQMTPEEFYGWITSGTIVRDLGPVGRDDDFGYGLIDAERAVQVARDGSVATTLRISPVSLKLGVLVSRTTITASRIGTGNIEVVDVTDDADWLTVSAADIDDNGLGTYLVAADRGKLSGGAYAAIITFVFTRGTSDVAHTVDLPVTLRVISAALSPDAGLQYVILVNHETDKTVSQLTIASRHGDYPYRFTDIPAGSYRLYSGTDLDNDFSVGDAGESIGAYLSTDQPAILLVESNRSGIDFITEFTVNIPDIPAVSANRLTASKVNERKVVIE
jgi:serine protease